MNEVSDLAFFVRLMQCGSLTATAQELGVTPPAVSRRLAALERRLGVRLLNRTTRSLATTPEGERYQLQAQRILEDIAEDAGLGRESLYKALTPGAKPRYDTMLKLLHALGFKLCASPTQP